MLALTASELLEAWGAGQDRPPIQRALMLLAAAYPDIPADMLGRLSIGQRDGLLLQLREKIFGTQLGGVVTCGGCGACLELSFHIADVRVAPTIELKETHPLSVAGYEVRFRLPNSQDLMALQADNDFISTCYRLLKRCILTAQYDGKETAVDQLPTDILDTIAQQMSKVDSQAEVYLSVSCPACSRRWQVTFDIVTFFWSEINAWAHRTLREVHALASAYGWSEPAILTLSPWRRRAYLELVQR